MPEIELTEREMLIARKAAKLAVEEVTKEFYKGVVQRFLVILGAAVVGWLAARGYVSFK